MAAQNLSTTGSFLGLEHVALLLIASARRPVKAAELVSLFDEYYPGRKIRLGTVSSVLKRLMRKNLVQRQPIASRAVRGGRRYFTYTGTELAQEMLLATHRHYHDLTERAALRDSLPVTPI